MKPATKANSKRANLKERALLDSQIKIHLLAVSKMDCTTDTDNSNGVMATNTKDSTWKD